MPREMTTPYFSTKSNLTYRGRELLIQTNLCSDQIFIFFCAFIWYKFPFFSLLLARVRLWELFLFSHNFPKALRTWFSPCAAAPSVHPNMTAKVLSHLVLSALQLWLPALETPVSDSEMHRGRRKRAQLHLPLHPTVQLRAKEQQASILVAAFHWKWGRTCVF